MSVRDSILDEAKTIINGEREGQYGKAEDSFERIACLWSAYRGDHFSKIDVAVMMILLKLARVDSGVYKQDNWIDICGYAAIGADIQDNDNSFILEKVGTELRRRQ